MFFIFEMIGTVAFAISGALVALKNKMDALGVLVLGMTTAIGGGVIRDLLLGITPPTSFQQPVYALTSLAVSLIVFLPPIRKKIDPKSRLLLVADALGLAIFTVVGARAGMRFNNVFLAVFVGALTGVGGGVLRDLFAGEQPAIFVRHFYACASIIGALVYSFLYPYTPEVALIVGAITVFVLRLLAVRYNWNLPR